MNALRRTLIKQLAFASAATAGIVAGVLRPGLLLAAEWNKTAFNATTLADALKGIGATTSADSRDIIIKAPEIAENGAVVPIEVTSKIPGTQTISVLLEKNPQPLAATFEILNGAEPYVSTRYKMAQTSNVKVIVSAGGKLYSASKEIKVTIGGCGG